MKFFAMMILGFSLMFGAVDINTADKKELVTLNGIGASKADAIITYRETHCFKTLHELTQVKGIGSKTIEKNANNLSVSKCKIK